MEDQQNAYRVSDRLLPAGESRDVRHKSNQGKREHKANRLGGIQYIQKDNKAEDKTK